MLQKSAFLFVVLFLQCVLLHEANGSSLNRFKQLRETFTCPAQDGFYGLKEGRCTADYYTCIDGLAFHSECPGSRSFTFTMSLRTAVRSDMVKVDTYTCPTSDGFFPIPGKCTADYYICVSGSPYVTTCPNATLFDPCTSICTRPALTSCNQPYVCPQPNGFFPTLFPCTNEYFTCIEGGAFLSHCPGTSLFEPSVNTCVAADKAPCKNQPSTSYCPSTPAPTTPAATTPAQTTPPPTTPESTTPTPTTTETTTTPTTTPTTTRPAYTCPAGVAGNYEYPGSCSLYYVCQSNGNYIVAQCPPGQAFNPVDNFCTSPANVPGCNVFRFSEYLQASRKVGTRGGPAVSA